MISISFRPPGNKKLPHMRKGPLKAIQRLSDHLEKVLAVPPSKVTTLKEMSPEKQAEMVRLYGRGP